MSNYNVTVSRFSLLAFACGDSMKGNSMSMLFTINKPMFGGALMNGLGEVRVFSSRELAEKHLQSMGEYLGNGESASGLIVYPVALDGESGLELD